MRDDDMELLNQINHSHPTKLKTSASLPTFFHIMEKPSLATKDCPYDHVVAKRMKKLQEAMLKSMDSQAMLQAWDQKNGLPLSHSPTMMNTSRSRVQLTDGIILKKWNGNPLIKDSGGLKVVSKRLTRKRKSRAKKKMLITKKTNNGNTYTNNKNKVISNTVRSIDRDESSAVSSLLLLCKEQSKRMQP